MKLKAKSLRPGFQSWHGVGLHKLFFRFLNERVLHLAEKLLGSSSWL